MKKIELHVVCAGIIEILNNKIIFINYLEYCLCYYIYDLHRI